MLDWVAQQRPRPPGTVADIGAGTGPGSRLLARRFPSAQIVAIDRSAPRLERLRAAAGAPGPSERIRRCRPTWTPPGRRSAAVDLAWAASSLHELADPDRLLRELRAGMRPGGLLAVVEMDALPRFLPEDIGSAARAWSAAATRSSPGRAGTRPRLGTPPGGGRLRDRGAAQLHDRPGPGATGHRPLRTLLPRAGPARPGRDRLSADDLAALDRLLETDHPDGLLQRRDLTVRGGRHRLAGPAPDSSAGQAAQRLDDLGG